MVVRKEVIGCVVSAPLLCGTERAGIIREAGGHPRSTVPVSNEVPFGKRPAGDCSDYVAPNETVPAFDRDKWNLLAVSIEEIDRANPSE